MQCIQETSRSPPSTGGAATCTPRTRYPAGYSQTLSLRPRIGHWHDPSLELRARSVGFHDRCHCGPSRLLTSTNASRSPPGDAPTGPRGGRDQRFRTALSRPHSQDLLLILKSHITARQRHDHKSAEGEGFEPPSTDGYALAVSRHSLERALTCSDAGPRRSRTTIGPRVAVDGRARSVTAGRAGRTLR